MENKTPLNQDELLDLFKKFEKEEIILNSQMSNIFGGDTASGDTQSRTPVVNDDCDTDGPDTVPPLPLPTDGPPAFV